MTTFGFRIKVKALLATTALLAIVGCSKQPTEYKADVKDESGQLIVEPATETGVPVDLPTAPMTNVPAGTATQ